jgi:hypothetical protein
MAGFGYARVSTRDQDVVAQVAELMVGLPGDSVFTKNRRADNCGAPSLSFPVAAQSSPIFDAAR